MRVVIASWIPHTSGISTYTLELAKAVSIKRQVALIGVSNPGSQPFPPGISYVPIGSEIPYAPGLPVLELTEYSRRISQLLSDAFGGYVLHETIPGIAMSVAGGVATDYGYVSYTKLAWIRTCSLPFLEALGAGAVTMQHALLDWRSNRNRSTVLSVSGGDNFIPPPISIRPQIKKITSEALRLLFVARDVSIPRKNLRLLLQAAREAQSSIDICVVGKHTGRFRRWAHSVYPRVSFLGPLPRESLLSYMSSVHALVNPSTYEEIGYVNLEALSMGLACIVSGIPSFKSILGEAALYFNPCDSKQLALLLKELSKNPDRLFASGQGGRKLISAQQPLILERLIRLYSTVEPIGE